MRSPVVGEHEAAEAPVALEDVLQQVAALTGVGPVQPVVGAHDRADVGLLYGRLELRPVDLAQRALVDHRVDQQAIAPGGRRPERLAGAALVGRRARALLVVRRVVLDVRDHALRLGTEDPADGHPRYEPGILAVGLEGAPVQRRPHDVHGRREDHVVALELGLVGHRRAVAPGQGRVEGRRERHRHGHRRRLPLARADRPVAVVGGRDADAHHTIARPGVRVRPAARPEGIVAGEQRDLLVHGQGVQQEVRPLVGGERRVTPGPRPGIAAAPGRGRARRARKEHRDRCRGRDRPSDPAPHPPAARDDTWGAARPPHTSARARGRGGGRRRRDERTGPRAPRWAGWSACGRSRAGRARR